MKVRRAVVETLVEKMVAGTLVEKMVVETLVETTVETMTEPVETMLATKMVGDVVEVAKRIEAVDKTWVVEKMMGDAVEAVEKNWVVEKRTA